MRVRPLLLLLLSGFAVLPARAQVLLEPFAVTTDARGAAVGDALVALPVAGLAFANPATLAGRLGITVVAPQWRRMQGYDPRDEYFITGLGSTEGYVRLDNLASFAAEVGTSAYGTFAVDGMTETRERGDLAVGETFRAHRYTLSWGIPITPRMSVGAAAGFAALKDNDLIRRTDRSVSAPFVSFGILYHESLLHSTVYDAFCFGASLTDLGTPMRFENDSAVNLPRTFRAGMSWSIAEPETTAFGNTSIGGRITGEYANVLNLENTTSKGFWSLGLELSVYDVLFFRYGLLYRPYLNRYAYADNGASTAGAGIAVPLYKIFGLDRPLVLTFDYAAAFLHVSGTDDLVTCTLRWENDVISPAVTRVEDN